jgi:disulfide bond formation protein DsbB
MSTQPQYEFTTDQNKVIDQLARNMRIVAVVMLFIGVLYLLAFVGAIANVYFAPAMIGHPILIGVAMLFYLTMGRWTDAAAKEFQKVVQTTGQDISHPMVALDNLRKLYVLMGAIIKVYLVLALIGLIVVVVTLVTVGLRN